MNTPIFRGIVEKGRVSLAAPEKYLVWVSKFEGKKIELTLKKAQSTRSTQANKYYWGVIVEILSQHCGYTKDEMHDALKFKFLSDKCVDEKGLVKIRSTAKLATDEFIQYTNQIVMWAAQDMGVFIPDPSQVEL